MSSPISLSIVIPVYNGGENFKRCLDSLSRSQHPPDEVIVVSDGDTDRSWKVGEASGAMVLRLPTSGGPAKARNLGAEEATSDIIFFVDADVELHPDTVRSIVEEFQRSPNLDALIGSYDDAPGAENFLSQYKNLFHHYTHQVSSDIASTFWGACGAIRRSVFECIGGFDEGYRYPCIEDIELGYRLRRAGYNIRLCKHIQVKHLKRWECLNLLRAEIFYRAIPWSKLMIRDRQFNTDLNLSYSNRFSVVIVFALIGSIGLSFFFPWLVLFAAALAIGLLIINQRVYRFFYQKRGLLFTLRVIPWHWGYFLYGGVSFGYAMLMSYVSCPGRKKS